MKEIITSLLLFMGQQDTGLPQILGSSAAHLPAIEILEKNELVNIFFGGNTPAGFNYKSNNVLALYSHKNKTIYVNKSVDLDTTFGESVLLHELVHFMQYETGVFEKAECAEANEKLAYTIQNRYLRDAGYGRYFSKNHIYFASMCPGQI